MANFLVRNDKRWCLVFPITYTMLAVNLDSFKECKNCHHDRECNKKGNRGMHVIRSRHDGFKSHGKPSKFRGSRHLVNTRNVGR